jgi:bleomycin hydrolase
MMHILRPYLALVLLILCFSTGRAQWADDAIKNELSKMVVPSDTANFKPCFHFKPVNQDTTLICWSFSGISFIETEMQRLGRRPVKLSVIYPVYYTFIEKAREFVRTRGASRFEPGDLFTTVFEIVNKYGIVPEAIYRGQAAPRATYNQDSLYSELKRYISHVRTKADWDMERNVEEVKNILNRHLGEPPATFVFEGEKYTPRSFLENRVNLPWEDYIAVTSFLYAPFDSFCTLNVPDNWRHNSKYFKVELSVFYQGLVDALQHGYSAAIDGDIGEPGRYGPKDVALIPAFDIPPEDIDQAAREYRFDKGLTTDDHLMHLIGYARSGDSDWFLVKDSWRDAWEGNQKGYFFYRSDFVKLKVLAYLVHRDAVPEITSRILDDTPVSMMQPFEP